MDCFLISTLPLYVLKLRKNLKLLQHVLGFDEPCSADMEIFLQQSLFFTDESSAYLNTCKVHLLQVENVIERARLTNNLFKLLNNTRKFPMFLPQ